VSEDLKSVVVQRSVEEVVTALRGSLERRSIQVFGFIDHAALARAAGLELADEVVVIFGNPAVGTTIMQGTQWAVFEPNDVDLWQRVKRNITSFLRGLWMDGALVGATPEQAFYVVCDESNNPASSVDEGKLIVEIGIAPVKPAEFVIFRISQWQGGGAASE